MASISAARAAIAHGVKGDEHGEGNQQGHAAGAITLDSIVHGISSLTPMQVTTFRLPLYASEPLIQSKQLVEARESSDFHKRSQNHAPSVASIPCRKWTNTLDSSALSIPIIHGG